MVLDKALRVFCRACDFQISKGLVVIKFTSGADFHFKFLWLWKEIQVKCIMGKEFEGVQGIF